MKKSLITYLLPILIFTSCVSRYAQSKRADPKDQLLVLNKEVSDDVIEQLKATQTIFFLNNSKAAPSLDSLKQGIKEGWTLTSIIFDDISNFGKYASNPKYSYFIIEGVNSTVTSQSGPSYTNTHYYLALRLFKEISKKGKIKTSGLCRIESYPDFKTIGIGSFERNSEKVINRLYEEGVFYNWSPVLLKAQLQTVSTNLSQHLRPWLFKDIRYYLYFQIKFSLFLSLAERKQTAIIRQYVYLV